MRNYVKLCETIVYFLILFRYVVSIKKRRITILHIQYRSGPLKSLNIVPVESEPFHLNLQCQVQTIDHLERLPGETQGENSMFMLQYDSSFGLH